VHKTHPFIELRDSEETFGKKTERKRKITQPSEVVLPPITETATEEKQSRSLTMQPTHEVAQGSVVTLDPPPQAALQQGTTPVNVPELLPAAGSSTHTGNENQMDPKQPATYPSSSNIQVVAPPAVTSTHATPVNNLQRPVISVPSNDQNLVPPYEATEIVQPGYDLRSNTSPDQSSTLEAAPFLPSLSSTPQYNAPSHSPGTPLLTTTAHSTYPLIEVRASQLRKGTKKDRLRKITEPTGVPTSVKEVSSEAKSPGVLIVDPKNEVGQGSTNTPQAEIHQVTSAKVPELLPAIVSTDATLVNNFQHPVNAVASNDQDLIKPNDASGILQPGSNASPDRSSTHETNPFLPSSSNSPQYNAPSHSPGFPLLTTKYG
ncbi:hypothetical protein HMI55_002567, partial [Coelomomyces lativittatus]